MLSRQRNRKPDKSLFAYPIISHSASSPCGRRGLDIGVLLQSIAVGDKNQKFVVWCRWCFPSLRPADSFCLSFSLSLLRLLHVPTEDSQSVNDTVRKCQRRPPSNAEQTGDGWIFIASLSYCAIWSHVFLGLIKSQSIGKLCRATCQCEAWLRWIHQGLITNERCLRWKVSMFSSDVKMSPHENPHVTDLYSTDDRPKPYAAEAIYQFSQINSIDARGIPISSSHISFVPPVLAHLSFWRIHQTRAKQCFHAVEHRASTTTAHFDFNWTLESIEMLCCSNRYYYTH